MKNSLSNKFNDLGSLVKEYLAIHLQLVKLTLLEKLVKIIVFRISLLVIIIATTILFLFASAAFVIWYGSNYQDYLTGLFIVMGVVVVLTLLFYIFRRILVESYLIKKLSSILLQDDDDED